MIAEPADYTKPRRQRDVRARLRPVILRGRERQLSHVARSVAAIEVYAVTRMDVTHNASRARFVTISLPRVRFLER